MKGSSTSYKSFGWNCFSDFLVKYAVSRQNVAWPRLDSTATSFLTDVHLELPAREAIGSPLAFLELLSVRLWSSSGFLAFLL